MTAPKPDRPWWRKKRWPALGLVWLVAAYPLFAGPAMCVRCWGPAAKSAVDAVYRPYWKSPTLRRPLGRWYDEYLWFWAAVAGERYGVRPEIGRID